MADFVPNNPGNDTDRNDRMKAIRMAESKWTATRILTAAKKRLFGSTYIQYVKLFNVLLAIYQIDHKINTANNCCSSNFSSVTTNQLKNQNKLRKQGITCMYDTFCEN